MLKEFKEFALRGSVVDLAVGFIVGAAFTSVVNSLVADLLMPPLGLLVGEIDFSQRFLILKGGDPGAPYATIQQAQEAGAVTLNYGLFLEQTLTFVLVAFAVFLVVRWINRLEKRKETTAPEAPSTTRECPYCVSSIPKKAVRCRFCTAELAEAE